MSDFENKKETCELTEEKSIEFLNPQTKLERILVAVGAGSLILAIICGIIMFSIILMEKLLAGANELKPNVYLDKLFVAFVVVVSIVIISWGSVIFLKLVRRCLKN